MTTVRTIADLRAALAPRRGHGRIGFVPTMGALHRGHAALIGTARAECAHVVLSVFVNPTQFNDPADLAAYPRQEEADARLAAESGADLFFAPEAAELYPAAFTLTVDVGGPSVGLEGAHRPGHCRGVATVCLKLFSIVGPDRVYLGQKDAQQIAVLQHLVRDANLPLEIRVVPTVRAENGLAESSRNVRLSADDRQRAGAIARALRAAVAAWHQAADPVGAARSQLEDLPVEYLEVVEFDEHQTLVLAVSVGGTRLIDNVPLDEPARAGLEPIAPTAVATRGHRG
jgi:pantoate--beta-alanine ligase